MDRNVEILGRPVSCVFCQVRLRAPTAELIVGFTLAAAVRYVRFYLPALGFDLPPWQIYNDRVLL